MSDGDAFERDLAEVVRLHPERDLTDEDALVETEPHPPFCWHERHGYTLHEEAHKVTCRGCGREVDPFKALAGFAQEWQRHRTFRQEAKRRADEAHARLKELLRLEVNARARLKRIDPEAARAAPQRPWGEGTPR